jgi:hypothetical protein
MIATESQELAKQDGEIFSPEAALPSVAHSEVASQIAKVRSFEDAMDYTFTNFDNALRKLAQ